MTIRHLKLAEDGDHEAHEAADVEVIKELCRLLAKPTINRDMLRAKARDAIYSVACWQSPD